MQRYLLSTFFMVICNHPRYVSNDLPAFDLLGTLDLFVLCDVGGVLSAIDGNMTLNLPPPLSFLWTPDSKAIVDGNLKLILGLIWTLILHYSISMPMWDEDEEAADDGKQRTPKQRLLGWIQNKLPELPITNFNRDWQTGRALGALVDSCAPGEGKRFFVCFFTSL